MAPYICLVAFLLMKIKMMLLSFFDYQITGTIEIEQINMRSSKPWYKSLNLNIIQLFNSSKHHKYNVEGYTSKLTDGHISGDYITFSFPQQRLIQTQRCQKNKKLHKHKKEIASNQREVIISM